MTKQEIFDKISKHLITQGCKSMNWGSCMYRGANNLKCAVGIMIPDQDYQSHWEYKSLKPDTDLWNYFLLHGYEESCLDMMRDLQDIHDNEQPYTWRENLFYFAKEHGLVYNEDFEMN